MEVATGADLEDKGAVLDQGLDLVEEVVAQCEGAALV